MRALAYVIVGFYFLEGFGTSFQASKEIADSEVLFVSSETSQNLRKEGLYLETTQNSINDGTNQDLTQSFKDDFTKPPAVISDPLFEDVPRNASNVTELNRKRDLPERGFTHENKMQILELHNLYRSNVTPAAGDMAYMEWDEELARLAQIWSDGCVFNHGMPDNDYPEPIGQNLYIGTDPTGYLGLYLWYEEYRQYELRQDYCIPGQQCGHYIQMAWALSNKLGCGMTKCGMRYLITCHYSPQALKGVPMYRVAKPCSQCPSTKGSLCLNNLCMTWEQCNNHPFDCQFARCDLECLNCGRLDKEKCLCECADGWDSPDCSYLCTDKHKRCGKSPGWPNKASCSLNRHGVANTYCRKMCDMCNAVDLSASNNTCCDGELCEDGFVLDTTENRCKCKLLCPGPHCDHEDAGKYQAALSSDANFLIPYLTCWIVVFPLVRRILWKII